MTIHTRRLAATLVAFAVVAGACGGTADTTTTTSPTTTTAPIETTTTEPPVTTTSAPTTTLPAEEGAGPVAYFFVEDVDGDGAHLVPVWRGGPGIDDTPEAALVALFEGPTQGEVDGIPSISTAIPDGTRLLGFEVASGVATVDVSGTFDDGGGSASMFGRLAQLAFTATRHDGIDAVVLAIDGEVVEVFSSEGIILDGALTREDYVEDHVPAIFVDIPAWGQPVTSPVTVTGIANVFEATFQIILTDDDGLPLAEEMVMATCGTGCWGTFSVDLAYEVDRDQFGALIVWAESAQDGSRIEVREYPVQLR